MGEEEGAQVAWLQRRIRMECGSRCGTTHDARTGVDEIGSTPSHHGDRRSTAFGVGVRGPGAEHHHGGLWHLCHGCRGDGRHECEPDGDRPQSREHVWGCESQVADAHRQNLPLARPRENGTLDWEGTPRLRRRLGWSAGLLAYRDPLASRVCHPPGARSYPRRGGHR